jgi:CRP/FNR family transcriptional regulator
MSMPIDRLLPREEIENAVIKKLAEGDVLIEEGSFIKYLPIVLSGSIKVLRTDDDGREMLLYYIKAGESCVMSFLGGHSLGKSSIRAVAEEDSEVMLLPVEKATQWLRQYPMWSDFMLDLYYRRFEELLEVINAVAFKKVDERLLDYLKRKSELLDKKELHITHEQIAQDLGSARVVISRLLKQLEFEKIVKLGRNKILLLQ